MDNNQPSTENRTFPLFGLLPGELRNAIWDFAATRDERPGAHFFLSHEIRDVDPTNQCVLGDTNDPHESLSAPQYSEDGETKTSWRTNNRSLYITDGGLWTACRESRAAMLRNQRRQPSSETHHPRRTGYFTDYDESGEKGEKQYFSILKHDLVCLQTPDIAQVHFGDALHPRLQDVENIALEFNPDWDFPTSADFFNVLYGVKLRTAGEALAEARYMNRTLWFIDYSIRRTKDPARANTSIRDDRPVFYGKGCRFVSVRPSDTEWEFDYEAPLSNNPFTVFGFVERMERASWILHYVFYDPYPEPESPDDGRTYEDELFMYEDDDLWEDQGRFGRHGQIGVLACEPLE